MTAPLKKPILYLLAALMAACLAAGTLSTKAAGAFWFGLAVAGLVSLGLGVARRQTAPPAADLALRLAGWWLVFCLLALGLKAIPMVYWSGPWEERHAEFRLLIGAIGIWLIARYARIKPAHVTLTGHALALACALALVLVLVRTSEAAPTNRIPWAAGVSLLSCTLLYWSYARKGEGAWTLPWRFASFLALIAVAFSGVRGAFLLILLWPLLLFLFHRQGLEKNIGPFSRRHWSLVAVATGLVVFAFIRLPENFSPVDRLVLAFSEAKAQNPNSSNGARLALWSAGAEAVSGGSLMGVGFTGGKALLKEIATNEKSAVIRELGHFHSDYLHTAVEFGILGLASYLSYAAGLLAMVIVCLRRRATVPAIGLTGILLMHASTGLTNVNFAHNYYPTLLSISVTLLILSCALHPPRKPAG